jgi:hypothetical protein
MPLYRANAAQDGARGMDGHAPGHNAAWGRVLLAHDLLADRLGSRRPGRRLAHTAPLAPDTQPISRPMLYSRTLTNRQRAQAAGPGIARSLAARFASPAREGVGGADPPTPSRSEDLADQKRGLGGGSLFPRREQLRPHQRRRPIAAILQAAPPPHRLAQSKTPRSPAALCPSTLRHPPTAPGTALLPGSGGHSQQPAPVEWKAPGGRTMPGHAQQTRQGCGRGPGGNRSLASRATPQPQQHP